ncbi:hypothetical protein DOQ73_24805 [Salmonella enterica subsp. enterica]|nr:hypothetical protein [Salmonella enterica subsp. enterica serovar Javiana]
MGPDTVPLGPRLRGDDGVLGACTVLFNSMVLVVQSEPRARALTDSVGNLVIPAQAGIHAPAKTPRPWVPAFAGTTEGSQPGH